MPPLRRVASCRLQDKYFAYQYSSGLRFATPLNFAFAVIHEQVYPHQISQVPGSSR